MTDQEPKQMANSLKEEYLVGSSGEVLKQAKEKAASLGIDVDKLL